MSKRLAKIKFCFVVGLFASTIVWLVGCTSTYIAGNVESPDGAYVVYAHIRGAAGRAYADNTRKTVFITIKTKGTQTATVVTNYQKGVIVSLKVAAVSGKPGKILLEKTYRIRGSDVDWDASWGKGDSVIVSLFDYGPGFLSDDARKKRIPKREIRMLHYQFDPRSQSFVEQQ